MKPIELEVEFRILPTHVDVIVLDHIRCQSANFTLSKEIYEAYLATGYVHVTDQDAFLKINAGETGIFLQLVDDAYQFQGIVLKHQIAVKDYSFYHLSV